MASPYPASILTPRLEIRLPEPGDEPAHVEAVTASLEKLAPWLPWAIPFSVDAKFDELYPAFRQGYLEGKDLTVFFIRRDTGELVGGSGLHNPDWELRRFEIGYWGNAAHSGHGYMTEGVKALADHAIQHMGARRLEITCDERNVSSWKLAERAGFRFEGLLRNERLDQDGNPRNTKVYSRVPGDSPTLGDAKIS